jgi:sulfur carrier protein ThiS
LIEVRLFGELRHHDARSQLSGTAIDLPADTEKTLGEILADFGIEPEAVGNVFVNGRLVPRSVYPITLGYPLTSQVPVESDAFWNTVVGSGDRLGLFPRTMSAVVV